MTQCLIRFLGLTIGLGCAACAARATAAAPEASLSAPDMDTFESPRHIKSAADLLPIVLSPTLWGAVTAGRAKVTADDGEGTLKESAEAVSFDWTPQKAGLITLTHTVVPADGSAPDESKKLTAQFIIDESAFPDFQFVLPVDFGEEGKKDVVVSWDWLKEKLDVDPSKDYDIPATREELFKTQENGLTVWQNYAVGLDGGKAPVGNDIVSEVSSDGSAIHIDGLDEAKTLSSKAEGLKVVFVLKKLVDGKWQEVSGKVSDKAYFKLDLSPDPTGLYRIFIRFLPDEKKEVTP